VVTAAKSSDPLRPTSLAEFAGQPDVVRELSIILRAAASRAELPPHLLFTGPQGLGKTTLAAIVAAESGLPLVSTSAPLLERPGDLVGLLVSLTRPSVVFVDEVHQLPKNVEETLYTAMEDGRIDIVLAEGSHRAKTIAMPLEPFVLVGATTKAGLLGAPFRDRFGYIGRLRPYDTATLATIVSRSARLLAADLDPQGASIIASRSRGTPRIANHWLRRVRDYAATVDAVRIGTDVTLAALDAFGVDALGLDAADRELLTGLCQQFGGGPVGVGTLATALGETTSTLEEVHEPYLMRVGLLARTPRGRVATPAAYTHLGLPVPTRMLELVADEPPAGETLPGLAVGE
jgi:Holliday junction DNA helicase RuvB